MTESPVAGRVPAAPRADAPITQMREPRLGAQAAQGKCLGGRGELFSVYAIASNQGLWPQPLIACLLLGGSAHLGGAAERGRGLLRLYPFLAEAKICQHHVSLWRRGGGGRRVVQD